MAEKREVSMAGGAAGVGAGAAAAAAALAAAQGYQLLVGGLLLGLPPEGFQDVHRQLGGLVLTGCTLTFWAKRPKTRFYFLPHQGVTLYCRMPPSRRCPSLASWKCSGCSWARWPITSGSDAHD
jgi:hypothetical protein